MPLEVRQVDITDFDEMSQFDDSNGESFVTPIPRTIWPPSPARNRWSLQQQRDCFLSDPTSRFAKVVDTDREDEIIALARWHFYPNGYQHSQATTQALLGPPSTEKKYPEGLNGALLEAIVVPLFAERQNWIGSNARWVLATLVTRASQKRRGAGGMLVKWGIDQAQKDQLPAYLEASTDGKPLYEKFGFAPVGELRIDLSKYGLTDPFVLAKMAWLPKSACD